MKAIQSTGHTIFFDPEFTELKQFISKKTYSKIFVLVDSNTEKYCLPILQPILTDLSAFDVIEIDAGEENKNIDFCIGIWKTLLDFEADRHCLLINLGGGVVTDMGSFAAATYKRGIDFIHIPTTLLAQVDAATGGKTGIDMDHIKNIIGTFTQPKGVFIIPDFLKTVIPLQLLSGFAEIIKHGLVYDANYFNQIQHIDLHPIAPAIIYRSIEIKNEIVMVDPLETGLRKILNFGHTIGHAIETYSLINTPWPLLHGEAIAIGIICEAYLSLQTGLSKDELSTIQQTVLAYYPKFELLETAFTDLIAIMKQDKKNNSGQINCSLLNKIGQCSIDNYCTEEAIYESMKYYQQL